MAKSEITVDVTSNLFSLCSIKCKTYNCVYKDVSSSNCTLKYVTIDIEGKCENYRTAGMGV